MRITLPYFSLNAKHEPMRILSDPKDCPHVLGLCAEAMTSKATIGAVLLIAAQVAVGQQAFPGYWLQNNATNATNGFVSAWSSVHSRHFQHCYGWFVMDGDQDNTTCRQWRAGTQRCNNQWVTFDFRAPLAMNGFALSNVGDTTHDVRTYNIQVGSAAAGPWTTVASGVAAIPGTTAFQNTTNFCARSRYWRWYITGCYSFWEPWVREVAWHVNPAPGACSAAGAPTSAPTLPPGGVPTQLPTNQPVMAPTSNAPTRAPSRVPTLHPTRVPTEPPTAVPTVSPTVPPTAPVISGASGASSSSSSTDSSVIAIIVVVVVVCAVVALAVVRRRRRSDPELPPQTTTKKAPRIPGTTNPMYGRSAVGTVAPAFHVDSTETRATTYKQQTPTAQGPTAYKQQRRSLDSADSYDLPDVARTSSNATMYSVPPSQNRFEGPGPGIRYDQPASNADYEYAAVQNLTAESTAAVPLKSHGIQTRAPSNNYSSARGRSGSKDSAGSEYGFDAGVKPVQLDEAAYVAGPVGMGQAEYAYAAPQGASGLYEESPSGGMYDAPVPPQFSDGDGYLNVAGAQE